MERHAAGPMERSAQVEPPPGDAPSDTREVPLLVPGEVPVKIKTRKPSAETTFRVLVGEQMDLTALADSKANMMIHINGLILSIMLASSGFILAAQEWLRLPAASLATTSVVSILFAVLAARPTIHNASPLSEADLASGRVNMLFFGDFARLPEDAFVAAMRDMFDDDERVYQTLSRHLHGLGHVLLRKFRLLRVSYTAFLVGLFVSGTLFVYGLLALQGAS